MRKCISTWRTVGFADWVWKIRSRITDASVIKADASRQRGVPGAEAHWDKTAPLARVAVQIHKPGHEIEG